MIFYCGITDGDTERMDTVGHAWWIHSCARRHTRANSGESEETSAIFGNIRS